mmetsp:Transcript_8292/g.12864  ORF Transcript_8292/g.12864 Transcript_8292/m.12864 type:complete len:209 (-) Transcript_8292:1591-2217(-)
MIIIIMMSIVHGHRSDAFHHGQLMLTLHLEIHTQIEMRLKQLINLRLHRSIHLINILLLRRGQDLQPIHAMHNMRYKSLRGQRGRRNLNIAVVDPKQLRHARGQFFASTHIEIDAASLSLGQLDASCSNRIVSRTRTRTQTRRRSDSDSTIVKLFEGIFKRRMRRQLRTHSFLASRNKVIVHDGNMLILFVRPAINAITERMIDDSNQ